MRPNVLLVVMDTARADAFEPYGAPRGTTPAVAEMARRGRAAPAAIAASSWTVPSHAAMFTGLLPRDVGLGQAPGGDPTGCRPRMEAQRERVLAEVFRRAGYTTAGMSANMWIRGASGFDVGFDRFVELRGRQAPEYGRSLRQQASWALHALRASQDDGAGEALGLIRTWLGELDRRAPFLWFVNLSECHSPYMPPRSWSGIGPLQRMRAGVEACRHLSMEAIWRASVGGFDVPEGALRRMRHLYGRAVSLMDGWIGDVETLLDEAGVLDETLVVVTSDHGENFGEQELMGHCFSLDQRLVHVPLVTAGPGAIEAGGVLSLRSLPRLLAEAAGVGDHPWNEAADGIAVSQFDGLVRPGDPRAAEAARTWRLGPRAGSRLSEWLTSATDGRLKVLRSDEGDRVCDLGSDPAEASWVTVAQARRAFGEAAVDPLLGAVEAAAVAAPSDAPDEPPPGADALGAAERADLERRMRLLGYM